jgi:hypothetical protein
VDDSSRLFNKQINRFISYLVLSTPHAALRTQVARRPSAGCYRSGTWQAGREARVWTQQGLVRHEFAGRLS